MVNRASLLLILALLPVFSQEAPRASDFGRFFLANAKGMISAQNATPAVLGGIAAGSAAVMDSRFNAYFSGERVAPAIGTIGNVLGNGLTLGAASGILFYTSYRGTNERFKAMSFDLTQGLALDASITFGVKFAVRRDRPDKSNSISFYSGHASATTTAATVVAHYYPKYAIPAYLVAAFTGFSRLEKNRHWLSDVVAGHAVGFIVGSTVVRSKNPMKIGRLNWSPAIAPGGGLAVNAEIMLGRLR